MKVALVPRPDPQHEKKPYENQTYESPRPLGKPSEAVERDDDSDEGAAWMRSFQAGNEAAFDRIVQHYQTGVYHFIRGILGDIGRAEDLTQEAFFRVYRSRGGYRPTARFKTWLFTIANRLALNEIRAIRRRRRVFSEGTKVMGSNTDDEAFWNSVADENAVSPTALAEQKELDEMLQGLVESLPGNQRTAIELQRTQKFSYAEMAAILQVTPAAVKSLLVRAREKLKSALDPYLSDDDNSTSDPRGEAQS